MTSALDPANGSILGGGAGFGSCGWIQPKQLELNPKHLGFELWTKKTG